MYFNKDSSLAFTVHGGVPVEMQQFARIFQSLVEIFRFFSKGFSFSRRISVARCTELQLKNKKSEKLASPTMLR